jgi:hypothetical protein
MALAEQELSVEVANFNGVHVNQVDVFEACQHQRFQQLTANPSCSHHQYFLLLLPSQQTRTPPCMYKTLEEEAEEEEGLSLLCYP